MHDYIVTKLVARGRARQRSTPGTIAANGKRALKDIRICYRELPLSSTRLRECNGTVEGVSARTRIGCIASLGK